jgi:hypothetical protein
MMLFRNRAWLAGVCVAIGLLQAWDSGVLGAAPWIQVLVAVAVVVPPLSWGTRRPFAAQALAVVAAFVLLTIARFASAVPLPTLHLAAFPPALLVFVLRGFELRAGSVQG